MKYCIFVFIFVTLLFAGGFGYTGISAASTPVNGGSDDIEITYINDWITADVVLGLDIYEYLSECYILASDPVSDHIQSYDASTTAPLGTMNLSGANDHCFGIAWNNNPDFDTYYINDWMDPVLYYTEDFGSTWTTAPNPAGNSARGMDFDGTDYWTTNGSGGGLWRFTPGAGQENIPTPFVTGQPSGLTVFPAGANLGIVITTYTNIFFFCEWDGSTMTLIGSTVCLPSCACSYGLAYSTSRDTFFWSYIDAANDYHLAEFTFEVASLEQSTWGAIKNSF
ncbi:MAG: hypothetical protein ABFR50_01005 [Candidatus Fermentibacteria bacterium]